MPEFRHSIDIAAPSETVFAYLTTDAGMTAWMGRHARLDPTPGGRFAVEIAGHAIRGEYVLVRVGTERHDEFVCDTGASTAQMGAGRTMARAGSGWAPRPSHPMRGLSAGCSGRWNTAAATHPAAAAVAVGALRRRA